MNNNADGRRWARVFLGLALIASTVGNVAHTVLADSTISLWLRIPNAVLWPLFTFGGIEIIVRMVWERKWTHSIGRNILLLPAIPAAIVSYQHLYSLLGMMGEEQFIATIGPFAIDGMMIGCTMVLVFTRPKRVEALVITEMQVADAALADAEREFTLAAMLPQPQEIAEIAPINAPPAAVATPRTRQARAQWDMAQVVELAVDNARNADASAKAGIGESTFGKYKKVAQAIKSNPAVQIDSAREKVPAEAVEMMRRLVNR